VSIGSSKVRECYWYKTKQNQDTVLLYEDGTMTCSCHNYGNVKAIQCAHIQSACGDFVNSHPEDEEMIQRIVEKKGEARPRDDAAHCRAAMKFQARELERRPMQTISSRWTADEIRVIANECDAASQKMAQILQILQDQLSHLIVSTVLPASATLQITPEQEAVLKRGLPAPKAKELKKPEPPKEAPTEPVKRKFNFTA